MSGAVYHRMTALSDSHVYVNSLQDVNRRIATSLADMSFAFGTNMYVNRPADIDLERFFKKPAEQKTPVPPAGKEDDTAPRPFKMTGTAKRRRKPKKEDSITDLPLLLLPNPIEGAAPSQLLDFLALTADLRIQARAERIPQVHAAISESFRSTLATLSATLNEEFNRFSASTSEGIRLAGLGEEEVLRRPKADVEVEAGMKEYASEELQTEEPEGKGKKGRGKSPPKRPPRGKKK
jgi:hypothetical protein